jgi:CubicO group peptidase (beta-lactamase class C family)
VFDLRELITPFQQDNRLPAIAAAVSKTGVVLAAGAVGSRKIGEPAPVTPSDKFHIGSCTKAMSATLAAMLVERGRIHWDHTLVNLFPERGAKMHAGYRKVTLEMLLTHRSGAPANSTNYGSAQQTITEQRLAYVDSIINHAPASEPGTRFLYSNAGYVIAGALLERVTGQTWEELIRQRIFSPLGMTSAGFGPPSNPNQTDQPWGHVAKDGVFEPRYGDNPRVLGPAGTVHCGVLDYLKFASLHASGGTRPAGLILSASISKLQQPAPKQDYAMGWVVTTRDWAKGVALNHNGSNTMNFFVVWIAPKTQFALAVASNAAGDSVPKVLDDVAAALVGKFA